MESTKKEIEVHQKMMEIEADLWDIVQNEIVNLDTEPLVVSACFLKVAVAMYKDELGPEYAQAILQTASDSIDETFSPASLLKPPPGSQVH